MFKWFNKLILKIKQAWGNRVPEKAQYVEPIESYTSVYPGLTATHHISPYSKNFKNSGYTEYGFEPIKVSYHTDDMHTESIGTTQLINSSITANNKAAAVITLLEPIAEVIPQSPVTVYTGEADDVIHIMNGYGVIVEMDGKRFEAFTDFGKDLDFKVGQKVKLYQHESDMTDKVATFISQSNNQRNCNINEILIQSIL